VLGAGAGGWRRGASAQPCCWPSNHALHPTAGRGALLLRARRCSAPAAGERERYAHRDDLTSAYIVTTMWGWPI
jgi:hypothetical protein